MKFLFFGHQNTKMLCNLYLYFARQDGQDGKNVKKITQPKYQKPKDKNMRRTKHFLTRKSFLEKLSQFWTK